MGRAFEFRKTRKLKRWGQMAKTFTKYFREIVMAVKEGGPDPDMNSKLRTIIQNAKADNVPKDNIARAIKKASNQDQSNYKEVVYEGYGPYGVAIVVVCATDNNTRTVANVRSYFNKANGSLGTTGSLDFLFDHKCVFKIGKKDGVDWEELELEMIDLGVDEVGVDEEEVVLYGEFSSFGKIQSYLEEHKYEIINANFERIPLDTKSLNEEQEKEIEKLLAKFEEDDDVQNVFHNMG